MTLTLPPKTTYPPMVGAHIARLTQTTHPIFRKRSRIFHILSDEFLKDQPSIFSKIDGKN